MRIAGLILLIAVLAWPFLSTLWAYVRVVHGARMMFPDPNDPRASSMYSMALRKAAFGFVIRGAIAVFFLANLVPIAREADRWHDLIFAWAR